MNLQVGQFYRRRDGEKVEIIAYRPELVRPYVGVTLIPGDSALSSWLPSGDWDALNIGEENPYDLVSEVKSAYDPNYIGPYTLEDGDFMKTNPEIEEAIKHTTEGVS